MKQRSSVQQKEVKRIQNELDNLIERAKQAKEKSSAIFDARWAWRKGREKLSDERKNNKPSPKEKLARLFKIDKKFKEIYDIKEEFRDIYGSKDKKAAKSALDDFVDRYGDAYPFLKKVVRNNETEILNIFTDDGKREIKYLPEHLVEKLKKFERRRGSFRTFESWEMIIDLLLEHSCSEN